MSVRPAFTFSLTVGRLLNTNAIIMANEVRRTERGWAGHYICSYKCLFRRNTLLEYGDVKVVVSTVGGQLESEYPKRFDTVGHGRYYETAAFMADPKDTRFNDIDSEKELAISSNTAIDHLDADDEANDMHEAVVEEMAERMVKGTLKLYFYDD